MALIVGVSLKALVVPLSLDQLLHCEEQCPFLGQTKKNKCYSQECQRQIMTSDYFSHIGSTIIQSHIQSEP